MDDINGTLAKLKEEMCKREIRLNELNEKRKVEFLENLVLADEDIHCAHCVHFGGREFWNDDMDMSHYTNNFVCTKRTKPMVEKFYGMSKQYIAEHKIEFRDEVKRVYKEDLIRGENSAKTHKCDDFAPDASTLGFYKLQELPN